LFGAKGAALARSLDNAPGFIVVKEKFISAESASHFQQLFAQGWFALSAPFFGKQPFSWGVAPRLK
jgi:hypothetical protein